MPPKRKFVLSTTVRWSAFEVQLFRYLNTLTHRTMADEMRTAIRFYARRLPEFSAEGFAEFVKHDGLRTLEKGPARDQLRIETDAFITQVLADDKPEVFDRVHGVADDTGTQIGSSAADFDLDGVG